MGFLERRYRATERRRLRRKGRSYNSLRLRLRCGGPESLKEPCDRKRFIAASYLRDSRMYPRNTSPTKRDTLRLRRAAWACVHAAVFSSRTIVTFFTDLSRV